MCSLESSFGELREAESSGINSVKKTLKQNGENYLGGLWNNQEKLRYVAFVLYNKATLSSKLQRRASKVFKQMSHFIGTRNPSQCRSQNQKMYKRFKTITRIVSEFKKEMGEQNFLEAFNKLSSQTNIKFKTELEQKSLCQGEEVKQPEKLMVSTSIQTEEPTNIQSKQMEENWMFEMFKVWMSNNIIFPVYTPLNSVFTS